MFFKVINFNTMGCNTNRRKGLFFLILFLCGQISFAQIINSSSISDNLQDVKLSKWKNGAAACIDFSFDDNNRSHKKISQILDEYGYKATFFVMPHYIYTDSLVSMVSNGHEIGNHTYDHPDLTTLDSANIDFQIRKGKEVIENKLGVKCVSFAEPGHQKNALSTRIAFKYHLFIRNYSEYPEIGEHPRIPYTGMTINKLDAAILNALKTGSLLQIAGHGMDGEGYEPVKESFFRQTLDLVKDYQNKDNIWVVPIREGVLYENLYHEVSIENNLDNDTLIINFNNFKAEKYKDLDSCMISVEFPNKTFKTITCLTDNVNLIELKDKHVLTTNLKKNLHLKIKLDSINSKYNVDSVNAVDSPKISFIQIRPNPVRGILNIVSPYPILKTEIYNSEGKCILTKVKNPDTVNMSSFPSGVYIIRVKIQNSSNQQQLISRRFVKI